MAVLKCDSCGAPLNTKSGNTIKCEYCGAENILNKDNQEIPLQDALKPTEVVSLSSIGNTIFEKKTFVIYRTYAELIDNKTKFIEIHIDFANVEKYKKSAWYGQAIKFIMKDKKKYIIRFAWESKLNIAMNALDGLIR